MLQTQKILVFFMITIFLSISGLAKMAKAEPVLVELPDVLKNLKVSGEAYVDYSNGQTGLSGDQDKNYNQFKVTRGYLTVKKGIAPWLGARITMDVHQDDTGDYKERMKYLYAEVKPGDLGFLTQTKMEIGQGHIPWLDFEEHVNPFRCQGTMAIERAGILNSSDSGVSIQGNFGGKLEDAKSLVGNSHYDGKYGSWHVGVYNGSGYHTKENNQNKVVEYRITVRPLADALPGLQLSYFGLTGEGNTRSSVSGDYPDYMVNLGMLSYQSPIFIFTGQYLATEGNSKGSLVDTTGDALKTEGYSFFGTVKLPVVDNKLSAFARFDHFDVDKDDKIAEDTAYDLYMAGLSYNFYKGNALLVDYETTSYDENSGGKGKTPSADNNLGDDKKFQAVWQVKF